MEHTKYKVLLIEDDNLDRMAFERFVDDQKLQYDYTEARSIFEAKEILKSEQFDIIISDYSLGDGTALDILNSVKNIPIILTTGAADEQVAIKAWRAGAYDYLPKDVDRNYLKAVPKAIENAIKRKKAEEKLKETMELKSQFISTVSHELRTPLAAMKEGLGIVLDGVVGPINEKQKKFLGIAKRNADRLSNLINDLLDFQRLGAGKTKLDIRSHDIKEVLSEVQETMTLFAKKNAVKLSFSSADDISKAEFDQAKVIQVLTNLVSNAIKFTPEKGCVSVNVRRQDNNWVISVSDTGMGIPKEALPKIFERFYRVNRRGKQIRGSGLGLAIVHKIVMIHGGRIEVESQVDQGTTFTVFLPLEAKSSPETSSEQENELLENTVAAPG